MKKLFQYPLIFILLLLSMPCVAGSLFDSNTCRKQVAADFNEKKKLIANDDFLNVFNQKLSVDERETLMFLYAYMPLSDIVDYSGEYYRMNVDYSLKARKEMSWGKKIPNILFRHFVLPVRVNNENLDDSRKVFYAEL